MFIRVKTTADERRVTDTPTVLVRQASGGRSAGELRLSVDGDGSNGVAASTGEQVTLLVVHPFIARTPGFQLIACQQIEEPALCYAVLSSEMDGALSLQEDVWACHDAARQGNGIANERHIGNAANAEGRAIHDASIQGNFTIDTETRAKTRFKVWIIFQNTHCRLYSIEHPSTIRQNIPTGQRCNPAAGPILLVQIRGYGSRATMNDNGNRHRSAPRKVCRHCITKLLFLIFSRLAAILLH